MLGLAVRMGLRKIALGTNGSSAAAITSAGIRIRSVDAHACRAMVIVGGVLKSKVRRSVDLVERADGFDVRQSIDVECPRVTANLPAHPRLQIAHEVPLIDEIGPALERANTLGELEDGETAHTAASDGSISGGRSPASFIARLPPSE